MCGIFALIENTTLANFDSYKGLIRSVQTKLNHRGPDSIGHKLIIDPSCDKSVLLVHTRLKINGNDTSQPLVNKNNTQMLIINGEIYNWKELEIELDYKCEMSDCEIIFPLYDKYKHNMSVFFSKLDGQYSFVLYDLQNKHIFVGRDPIGVTPLYIGIDHVTSKVAISSELKCLDGLVQGIKIFYPRTYFYSHVQNISSESTKVYIDFFKYEDAYIGSSPSNYDDACSLVKQKLSKSVETQICDILQNDIEFGVLLSGGLDSSLIASLCVDIAKKHDYIKPIKTFSIGVHKDVPDLVAARKVASFLGTDHYEYYMDINEGIQSIEKVVWYIETYDCTSVRASTPMFLLTSKIKSQFPSLKVLFSGELSDETLCYLYGANAPTNKDFQTETIRLVSDVHMFDCLRANKTCMAHSIEVRVPFTNLEYVKAIFLIDPKWKTFNKSSKRMEKQILRDAFKGVLPHDILYRKKEQFSDGVSGFDSNIDNWIDCIKRSCENKYTNEQFDVMKMKYTYNRPETKEQLFYRETFCKHFNQTSYKNTSEFTVKFWVPKWGRTKDPSGRAQDFWVKN